MVVIVASCAIDYDQHVDDLDDDEGRRVIFATSRSWSNQRVKEVAPVVIRKPRRLICAGGAGFPGVESLWSTDYAINL